MPNAGWTGCCLPIGLRTSMEFPVEARSVPTQNPRTYTAHVPYVGGRKRRWCRCQFEPGQRQPADASSSCHHVQISHVQLTAQSNVQVAMASLSDFCDAFLVSEKDSTPEDSVTFLDTKGHLLDCPACPAGFAGGGPDTRVLHSHSRSTGHTDELIPHLGADVRT